jgi:hypothetical protein
LEEVTGALKFGVVQLNEEIMYQRRKNNFVVT